MLDDAPIGVLPPLSARGSIDDGIGNFVPFANVILGDLLDPPSHNSIATDAKGAAALLLRQTIVQHLENFIESGGVDYLLAAGAGGGTIELEELLAKRRERLHFASILPSDTIVATEESRDYASLWTSSDESTTASSIAPTRSIQEDYSALPLTIGESSSLSPSPPPPPSDYCAKRRASFDKLPAYVRLSSPSSDVDFFRHNVVSPLALPKHLAFDIRFAFKNGKVVMYGAAVRLSDYVGSTDKDDPSMLFIAYDPRMSNVQPDQSVKRLYQIYSDKMPAEWIFAASTTLGKFIRRGKQLYAKLKAMSMTDTVDSHGEEQGSPKQPTNNLANDVEFFDKKQCRWYSIAVCAADNRNGRFDEKSVYYGVVKPGEERKGFRFSLKQQRSYTMCDLLTLDPTKTAL